MSKRLTVALTIIGIAAVVGIVTLGLSSLSRKPLKSTVAPTPSPEEAGAQASGVMPQSNEAGGVTLQVTFDPKANQSPAITFQVSMNTHSVELSQFDLARLSRLTLEPGGPLPEIAWKPEGDGTGHHVSGILTVQDPAGKLAGARTITLEVEGLADPSVRRFQWQRDG